MKVRSVTTYQARDNTARWKTTFEETVAPLITGDDPKLNEGDEVPHNKLKLIQKGDNQYYVWNKPAPKKSYGKSPEERAEIQASVAIKALTDIFIAGKLDELEQPTRSPLTNALATWIGRALVQDPLMKGILEDKHGTRKCAEEL